jgi:peptidoglycan lytic transglycosylase
MHISFSTLFFNGSLFLSLALLQWGAIAQDINPMRKTFLQAEKRVWQADSPQYQNLYNQLHFYPLQPYLDQKRLMSKMTLANAAEIEQFLTTYQGSPLDWPLRKKWLNYLAKRERKALFLKFYRPNNSAKLNCTKIGYQLDAGMPEVSILPQVTKWWTVGKSQDKACDPLFKKWISKGYLTPEIVWQRLTLAANGGKHTLIPYLTSLLPKEEQYLGLLWHSVRRDPAYISRSNKFPNKNAKEVEILTYGLKRLVWRAPERALSSYKLLTQRHTFSPRQLKEIHARFAIALSSKNHQSATKWLAKVDSDYLTTDLIQWRLVNVLKSQNWQLIHDDLLALPENTKQAPQWQYWFGRSLLESGKVDEGTDVLNTLAKTRHYYGFLAASLIEQPISLQNKPLDFSDIEKEEILANPAAKRAFELFHLQRYHQARSEWNYWLSQLNKQEKLIAASAAYDNEWFDRPIFTLAKEGYLDDVKLRFPMAYPTQFTSYAKKANIDSTWAMAISRRESSFMSDAKSGAGAKGLMQIMPDTAKQLERRSISNKYLYKAENNIKLGTKYLGQLLKRYDGNQVLATASYNAGPYRVKKWLENINDLPADIWIETIPFKETRDYVKSVFAYQEIYQHHEGGKQTSPFTQLVNMHIEK